MPANSRLESDPVMAWRAVWMRHRDVFLHQDDAVAFFGGPTHWGSARRVVARFSTAERTVRLRSCAVRTLLAIFGSPPGVCKGALGSRHSVTSTCICSGPPCQLLPSLNSGCSARRQTNAVRTLWSWRHPMAWPSAGSRSSTASPPFSCSKACSRVPRKLPIQSIRGAVLWRKT
jgi:hypothetical protein